ncbi:MAG: hypothetical protein WCW44_04870 [archaeon]|jgi:hypothetical protein
MSNPTIKGLNFQTDRTPQVKGINFQTQSSGLRVKALNFWLIPTATLKGFAINNNYVPPNYPKLLAFNTLNNYTYPGYPKLLAFHTNANLNFGWPKFKAIKFKNNYVPPNYPKVASMHFRNTYLYPGYPKAMAIKFFVLQGTGINSGASIKSTSVIS